MALTSWDYPDRARVLGIFQDAVADAGAAPPADLPAGPDMFRFSDDGEFNALMNAQGLEEREVRTIAFTHSVSSADELWDGFLAGSLRMAVRITSQDEQTQRRIRAALDRVVEEYRRDGGLELPVSAKLATGRKPT